MQIGGGQNRLKADSHFTHSHKTNSHTLPKISISLALLLGGANIALAEESGGFVGFGVGYGDAKMIISEKEINQSYKAKTNGVSYGFVAGYKQFFNDYLGLRYYVNLDLYHNMTKNKDWNDGKMDLTLINYGVNVDFLGNFVSTEIADFGGFIGLGIGGNTWIGKDIQDLKNKLVLESDKVELKDTSFDVALNVGLRTNIAKYHGLEVAVRVPFLNTRLLKVDFVDGSVKYEIGQNVIVLARYTFSF